jgi:hypothetical protein
MQHGATHLTLDTGFDALHHRSIGSTDVEPISTRHVGSSLSWKISCAPDPRRSVGSIPTSASSSADPAWLIKHPRAVVLFDTGLHPERRTNLEWLRGAMTRSTLDFPGGRRPHRSTVRRGVPSVRC